MPSKYIETMIRKHGSYEAYREHMRKIASKGGKNGRTPIGTKRARELGKLSWKKRLNKH